MAKVLNPGLQTLVNEWIGRVGYMELGISHSGTMDNYASRFANMLVGNDLNAPMLELTAGNFVIEFEEDKIVALTGAEFGVKLAGAPAPMWESFAVKAGDRLQVAGMNPAVYGFRVYLAVSGGVDVPEFMGSKTTSSTGTFGGYEGRAIKKGDVIKFGPDPEGAKAGMIINPKYKPTYSDTWEMHAIPGPQGAPDFFTEEGMELFFTATWSVQTIADRTGIRLDGPDLIFNPERAAAGGHPSNIIDHGYPGPGCVNVSGNTPILFPRECPTSGGFIVALSTNYADQWMMGQMRPGMDKVKFILSTQEEAIEMRKAQNAIFADPEAVIEK